LLKKLKSGVPSAKMTKYADVALKMLFHTNSCTFLKTLKSGVPRAKMTKRADLGLKMLFRTNLYTLLKIFNKCGAHCENDKTCEALSETAVFVQTRALS